MSVFRVPLEIGAADGGRWERLEALVDTGSSYTCVPRDVLAGLGVSPRFRRRLRTADERLIERDVGVALARLDGLELPTIVVFTEEGGTPLLGAVTLEEFGLGLDPGAHHLVPIELRL